MSKCVRCNRSTLLRGKVELSDSVICSICFKALGFDKYDADSRMKYADIKDGKASYQALKNARYNARYEFLVHFDSDKTVDRLEKYQKEWTEREDQYEGMRIQDIKEEGVYDHKYYKYPPLDVDLEIFEAAVDGKPAVGFNLIDGKNNPFIGYAPKTKARKILSLIKEHDRLKMSAELTGGNYRKLCDRGSYDYVSDDYDDPIKIRVTLDWSADI